MAAPSASLAGKTALVTGGGSGIGAAIARALDGAGAEVSLLGRRAGPLAEVRATLARPGRALVADVTDPAALDARARRRSRRSTSWSTTPARPRARRSRGPIRALLERMLAVNLVRRVRGHPAAAAAAARAPRPAASSTSRAPPASRATPMSSAYCAAKHGLVGLTRALAQELAGDRRSPSTRSARASPRPRSWSARSRRSRPRPGGRRPRRARRSPAAIRRTD